MHSLLELAVLPKSDAEAAFRASYDGYFLAIHRYVARLSGDSSQAEDVAQEVFARFWRQLVKGDEPANVRAWLFRVASNLVVSRFRSRTRALRFLLPFSAATRSPLADTNIEREIARREIIQQVLARLPEPMRQCLLLHHEGLTGREIAEVLQVKASYVCTLVFRAHERFRRECDALGGRDGLLG